MTVAGGDGRPGLLRERRVAVGSNCAGGSPGRAFQHSPHDAGVQTAVDTGLAGNQQLKIREVPHQVWRSIPVQAAVLYEVLHTLAVDNTSRRALDGLLVAAGSARHPVQPFVRRIIITELDLLKSASQIDEHDLRTT